MSEVYALDAIVAGVVVLSALIAYFRGFVREALSLASWVGALFATLYAFTPVREIAREHIPMPMLADITTGAGLFVVSLLVLSLIGGAIARRVSQSGHGAIDRSLGFLFGLFRGALVVAVLYMLATWIVTEQDQPEWVTEAKVFPLMRDVSREIELLLPAEMRLRGKTEAEDADRRVRELQRARELYDGMRAPAPALPTDGTDRRPGYDPADRERLDEQIRRIQ